MNKRPPGKTLRTTEAESGRRVSLLWIGPAEESCFNPDCIRDHFACEISRAGTCSEALELLRTRHISVIVCEERLPDGDWRCIREAIQELGFVPALIVVSRLADERLWAEVLNLGGHDVLVEPFEPEELIRTVGTAWRRAAHGRSHAA